MGASEWGVSIALYVCDLLDGWVLYLFPTTGDVSDFSSSRIGPAIEASPYLTSLIVSARDRAGAVGRRGADRTTLMRIRNAFLYLRGTQIKADGKARQLKSVSADMVVYDELDEMDPRALSLGEKRLGHSKLKFQRYISTPTYPGVGIHDKWSESDQREWSVKCPKCGHWQALDINSVILEYDTIGRPTQWHGKKKGEAWAGCSKCGSKLDRLGDGEWIAKYPERNMIGYHLTKVFSHTNKLLPLIENLITTDETQRREGYNQDWGTTYTPEGTQLTTALLDGCRREYLKAQDGADHNNIVMGIDVGSVLHVVIRGGENLETGERPLLYVGEVDWNDIVRLKIRYRVRCIVIDALPETRKARELQAEIEKNSKGGKCYVFLAYYSIQTIGSKKTDPIQIDTKEGVVNCDRTRTLDETFAMFLSQENTLYATIRSTMNYYDHLTALIRVIENNRRGQSIATYIHSRPDHFAHAENYCMIASKTRPTPTMGVVTNSSSQPEPRERKRSSWR